MILQFRQIQTRGLLTRVDHHNFIDLEVVSETALAAVGLVCTTVGGRLSQAVLGK